LSPTDPARPIPEIRLVFWEDENWQEHILALAATVGFPQARLTREPGGKPLLSGAEGFHFNISTTRGRTVAAWSSSPVGVDWEHLERKVSARPIARRYFSENEIRWLESNGAAGLERRFFLLWTAKEAGVKLDGCGLYTGGLCHCRIQTNDLGPGAVPARGSLNGKYFLLRSIFLPGGALVTVAAFTDFRLVLPADSPQKPETIPTH